MIWRCRDFEFDLTRRVLVMGVLNVTPDSFSDGGRFAEAPAALEHAREMIAEGADLIDLGGESTRPGSAPVPAAEQWRRIGGVLAQLIAEGACVSVDTASAEVAEQALAAGAHAINDVTALGDSGMAAAVSSSGAGVVLMHMRGNPATMQHAPSYDDCAREVGSWLAGRVEIARGAGIAGEAIALDPGVGFGKRVDHSLELIARIAELAALGHPVLIGASRKSFIGRIAGGEVHERLGGSNAAHAIAVFEGAHIVRTHDVRETVRAVAIARALRDARRPA
jgi:dihydropteroate synthase